jgi:hypothetical protein
MPITRRNVLLGAGTTALAAGITMATATTSDAATVPPASYPHRLIGMPVRDPYVTVDAGTGHYYLYATNDPRMSGVPGVGTMVYRSRDLQHWSDPVVVFTPDAAGWAQSGAWAPEVHRWQGRWYLFTTLHNTRRPLPVPKPNANGIPVQIPQFQRGTIIAVADSLLGPFVAVDLEKPVTPQTFMTLDGTLFTDGKGGPWMVYAHEWVQKIDGTVEAIPLKKDLTAASGKPIHLFKGSDATWISQEMPSPSANQILPYVTDGPQLIHLPGGALAMLWSTYEKTINSGNGTVTGHYVVASAVSPSGKLHGPWTQRAPLLRHDTGHGMVFHTLPTKGHKSRPMLIAHHGTTVTHPKLYEIELRRDGLRLGKHRKDLDGSA